MRFKVDKILMKGIAELGNVSNSYTEIGQF